MNLYLSVLFCFLPLIILCFITISSIKSFSLRLALLAILCGLASIIPTTIIQYFVMPLPIYNNNTLLSVIISALVFNSMIEETFKLIFIGIMPKKNKAFIPFFVASLIVGCSFGCFEAVIYLIAGSKAITLRLFTAVILHTLCAGLSGIYVWTYKNTKGIMASFITAIILHGVYNFFAAFSNNYWWFSIVTLLFLLVRCRVYYVKVQEG